MLGYYKREDYVNDHNLDKVGVIMRRNTIQQALTLEAVKKLCNHPKADEVYAEVVKTCPTISRATVYRNLSTLAKYGELLSVEIPGGAAVYDHNTHKHCHARCLACGRIFDVECEDFEDLRNHIKETYGFEVVGYDLVFKGYCKSCEKPQNDEETNA